MKRIFLLVLMLINIVALCGCKETGDELKNSENNIKETTEEKLTSESAGNQVGNDTDYIFDAEDFDVTFSNASINLEGIWDRGLNSDKVDKYGKVFPVYKFDTFEELVQFKNDCGGPEMFEYGYGEVSSFNDVVDKYDEKFFEDNSLVLIYIWVGNCTYRYWLDGVYCDGESLCIYIDELNNDGEFATAEEGWFLTVAVEDSLIENCTKFDAIVK